MTFGEKVKSRRIALGMTQPELAKTAGISLRSVCNYEAGMHTPKNIDIAKNIATALSVTVEYLLDEANLLVIEAASRSGSAAAKDIGELVGSVSAMFAGGELSEEDMDKVMHALNDAYWIAKAKNKKYAPQKSTSADKTDIKKD